MSIDPKELESLNRDELINRARQLGAHRPELLTRPELRDEIIRLSEDDEAERRRARGWFGVARDLVASVVGQGLNLPDTAELIRGVHVLNPRTAPPVATVTLAEIYAAQGHVRKALDLLDEVLANEPDHEAARVARLRLSKEINSSQRAVVAQATSSSSQLDAAGPETTPSSGGLDAVEVAASADLLGQPAAQPTPDCASLPNVLSANDTGGPSGDPSTSTSVTNETLPSPAAEQESSVDAVAMVAHDRSEVGDPSRDELLVSEPAAEAVEPPQATLPVQLTNIAPIGVASDVEPERPLADDSLEDATFPGTAQRSRARREASLENSLFIVRLDAHEVYGAWRITAELLDAARKSRPNGALVLRVVEVTTSWDGPETHESTWELTELEGYRRIQPKGSPSQLRAAIGLLEPERFTVLVIGSEFAWSDENGSKLLWAPPAIGQADELQRSAASAVARLMQSVRAA